MLTAGVAVWRAWQAAGGPQPAIVAGHSLGEYTALVAAGALAFRDAVPLVRFRAQAMQEAVPAGVGAMAAILGVDDDAVARSVPRGRAGRGRRAGQLQCARPGGDRRPQGGGRARDRGGEGARREARRDAAGVRAVPQLAAASPRPSGSRADSRRCRVRDARDPGAAQRRRREHREPDAIREALARQAASPVRWTETIQRVGRARRDARRRMRARQGAGGPRASASTTASTAFALTRSTPRSTRRSLR